MFLVWCFFPRSTQQDQTIYVKYTVWNIYSQLPRAGGTSHWDLLLLACGCCKGPRWGHFFEHIFLRESQPLTLEVFDLKFCTWLKMKIVSQAVAPTSYPPDQATLVEKEKVVLEEQSLAKEREQGTWTIKASYSLPGCALPGFIYDC